MGRQRSKGGWMRDGILSELSIFDFRFALPDAAEPWFLVTIAQRAVSIAANKSLSTGTTRHECQHRIGADFDRDVTPRARAGDKAEALDHDVPAVCDLGRVAAFDVSLLHRIPRADRTADKCDRGDWRSRRAGGSIYRGSDRRSLFQHRKVPGY